MLLEFPKKGDPIILYRRLTLLGLEMYKKYEELDKLYDEINKVEQESSNLEEQYNKSIAELVKAEGGIETIDQEVLGLSTELKIDIIPGEDDWFLQSITVDGVLYSNKIHAWLLFYKR